MTRRHRRVLNAENFHEIYGPGSKEKFLVPMNAGFVFFKEYQDGRNE